MNNTHVDVQLLEVLKSLLLQSYIGGWGHLLGKLRALPLLLQFFNYMIKEYWKLADLREKNPKFVSPL